MLKWFGFGAEQPADAVPLWAGVSWRPRVPAGLGWLLVSSAAFFWMNSFLPTLEKPASAIPVFVAVLVVATGSLLTERSVVRHPSDTP